MYGVDCAAMDMIAGLVWIRLLPFCLLSSFSTAVDIDNRNGTNWNENWNVYLSVFSIEVFI